MTVRPRGGRAKLYSRHRPCPPLTRKLCLSPIAQAIRTGAARLERIADNPRLEARLLLAHALGLTQTT